MNINTSQSTDSLKGAAGNAISIGDGKTDNQATGETTGFFDKLTALMFGSSHPTKASAEGNHAKQSGEATSDILAALKKMGWTKAQLEHLKPNELSTIANQQGISVEQLHHAISNMPSVEPSTKQPTTQLDMAHSAHTESVKPQSKSPAVDVPSAMDEGKQLLGKLQQANQTLTKSSSALENGKDLPQNALHAVKASGPATDKDAAKTADELAQWPMSPKEKMQLIALKQQHPKMSEHDLKQHLMALRAQQKDTSDAPLERQTVAAEQAGVSPMQPTPSKAGQDSTPASVGASNVVNQAEGANKGALQAAVHGQVSQQPAQHGVSEHKAMLQATPNTHTTPTPQDSVASAQGQSAQVTAQSQGTNPAAAALLGSAMAAGGAKGSPNVNADKGLTEKALHAMTESKTGKSGQASQESSLASQISSAAGQQLSATQKVDGTQQSSAPQLQLSKDGADQVAEKVHMMMSKNLKSIDIRLDPPEMGKMHIKLHINNDGGASVHFTVASHQARDAIEHSMPRLRDMLSQQGVQLGGTSVQQDGGGQQQSFASANGGQSQSHRQSGTGVGSGAAENVDGDIKLDLNVAAKRDGISYYA